MSEQVIVDLRFLPYCLLPSVTEGLLSLLTLMCFFIFDKRATHTIIFDLKMMIWFVNMIAWGAYCLRWKTLSSHKSFNSKRFELFDHSEMPVLWALSEILKRNAFKEGSTLENSEHWSVCNVQWVILFHCI